MGESEGKILTYPIPRVLCGAKTRSGSGVPCRQPAMPNGRCRLHGGKSLSGVNHGRFKHGFYTQAMVAERRDCKQVRSVIRKLMRGTMEWADLPDSYTDSDFVEAVDNYR